MSEKLTSLSPQLIQELREFLQQHNGEKVWDDFPDHVVVFYAKSYLANTKNAKYRWYQNLQNIFADHILLSGEDGWYSSRKDTIYVV